MKNGGKPCVNQPFRVNFAARRAIKIGPETRWKRETGPDHIEREAFKMAIGILYRQGRIPATRTDMERAPILEARP